MRKIFVKEVGSDRGGLKAAREDGDAVGVAKLAAQRGFERQSVHLHIRPVQPRALPPLRAPAAAKEAIVITTPEVSAVRDADRVIGLLNTHGVSPVQLVLNRVRPKMMANQEMLAADDVTDILALPLLGLVLEDEQVIVSTNRGEPLTLSATNSPASRAYSNIARRLQGEDVPLIDPAKEGLGLREKVWRLMQTKIF